MGIYSRITSQSTLSWATNTLCKIEIDSRPAEVGLHLEKMQIAYGSLFAVPAMAIIFFI